MIRLELKTSVYEMNVTVVSTVTGCDVTTVQQHCKGSTSMFAICFCLFLEFLFLELFWLLCFPCVRSFFEERRVFCFCSLICPCVFVD